MNTNNREDEQLKAALRGQIVIENFPSRMEMYQILNEFLRKNQMTKEYSVEDKENSLVFVFKYPVTIFSELGCSVRGSQTSE